MPARVTVRLQCDGSSHCHVLDAFSIVIYLTMFIWFPYKTPENSECHYNTHLPEIHWSSDIQLSGRGLPDHGGYDTTASRRGQGPAGGGRWRENPSGVLFNRGKALARVLKIANRLGQLRIAYRISHNRHSSQFSNKMNKSLMSTMPL